MNPLNSVIIEGAVLNNVREFEGRMTFKLISTRYTLQQGDRHQELSFFDVEVLKSSMIAPCRDLTPGRGVRIVGRMRTEESNGRHFVVIVAESVEIKMRLDTKPEALPEVTP